MRHLLAIVAIIALLLACSSPQKGRPDSTATTTAAWKEVSLSLHGATEFTELGRESIREASNKWRAVSGGRIRIDVVFDLDFNSLENLEEHQRANHSLLIGVLSRYPIAEKIDELLGSRNSTPMAATIRGETSTLVFLIVDRIDADDFESVVTHELGHVAGLPDLPTFGSVMSGARLRGAPAVNEFTHDDVTLCRAALLCP